MDVRKKWSTGKSGRRGLKLAVDRRKEHGQAKKNIEVASLKKEFARQKNQVERQKKKRSADGKRGRQS
jgi:hypothetical protein